MVTYQPINDYAREQTRTLDLHPRFDRSTAPLDSPCRLEQTKRAPLGLGLFSLSISRFLFASLPFVIPRFQTQRVLPLQLTDSSGSCEYANQSQLLA